MRKSSQQDSAGIGLQVIVRIETQALVEIARLSPRRRMIYIAMGDAGKVYGFNEASATADKRALA